ncbi:MAG TPA: beta-ketoacyl-[acyl-carrier-protein] synthase family protein [Polyangiaceae bacterium]|nr:beta-ketoacyl-[acyl-carrier-protein] synthase family protein [Polyangiaceae bacterium]
MQLPQERIAVTGIGIVSALGRGARATFSRVLNGERGMAPVSLFDTAGLRSTLAAEVPAPLFAELRAEAGAGHSRTDVLALCAARDALKDAGWAVRPYELALAVGGTTGGMLETESELLALPDGETNPERAQRLLSHPLSTTVRTLEQAITPFRISATVCSACSSSAVALVQGAHWIRAGEARAVLAGGADALCRMTFAGFNALGAMDAQPCRPFDVARGGLTLGEGAAFLLLESESSARQRGARVLAWFSGWSVGAEAHHVTQPEPTGRRAGELIGRAIASAGLSPADIHYVNAHGTATHANDAMEVLALRRVFADSLSGLRVSSSKGQLGHTLGAAGALEAAITVLALESGVAPPSGGLLSPEAADLKHVLQRGEATPMRAALSSSFGFGGMSAVLAFEHRDSAARVVQPDQVALVITSAVTLTDALCVDAECAAAASGPAFAQRLPLEVASLLDPERSRRFDRSAVLTTWLVGEALKAAQLAAAGAGLVLGNAYGSVERSVQFLDRFLLRGLRHAAPAEFPHLVQSAACGNASIYWGLTGPVLTVADGSTSAEAALARAVSLLSLGMADAIIAGAVQAQDALVTRLGPRAQNVGTPISRSEGGGFVVVETRASAQRRGKRPLAELVAHSEQRAAPKLTEPIWSAPLNPTRARVVLSTRAGRWEDCLDRSPWAGVERCHVLPHVGFHEASGAIGLGVAVATLQAGCDEVLVFSGEPGRGYIARLRSSEALA